MLLNNGISQTNVVNITNIVNVVNITNIVTITRINYGNRKSVLMPQDEAVIYSEYSVFPSELIRRLRWESMLERRQRSFMSRQFPN